MSFCEKYEFFAKKKIFLWIFAKLVFLTGTFQKILVHSGTFRYGTN